MVKTEKVPPSVVLYGATITVYATSGRSRLNLKSSPRSDWRKTHFQGPVFNGRQGFSSSHQQCLAIIRDFVEKCMDQALAMAELNLVLTIMAREFEVADV